MTRRLKDIMLAAGCAALLASVTLSAQNKREVADIPFAFHANGVRLGPGTYVFKQVNDGGLFQVSDSAGGSIFVSLHAGSTGAPENPRLDFRCYGSDRVLAQVWTPEGTSYSASESTIEKDLHRRVDMATLVSAAVRDR